MFILALSESYANTGLVDEVKELVRSLNKNIRFHGPLHKPSMGIDEILNRIRPDNLAKWLQRTSIPQPDIVLVAIDKEEGIRALYVDKSLCVDEELKLDNLGFNISVCTRKHGEYTILSIIFRPRIEEGLLCKIEPRICRDIHLKSIIKSRKGRTITRNLVRKHSNAKELVEVIAKKILEAAQ